MINKIKNIGISAYNWVKGKLIYFLIGGIAIASTPAFLPDDPTTTGELIQENGIEIVLQGKTAKQKAKIKSQELAKVKIGKYTKNGFDIEIIGDIKEIEINGQNGIELFATAHKNGKQLGFGKDGTIDIERFRIYNPPVLVDDENGEIIREWTDEITGQNGQRKLKYDPTEAIKQSLSHTISLVAKDGKDIVKGKIGNTTSTFYPAAGANSPVDGWIKRDGITESWNTIRTSTGVGVDVSGVNIVLYWSYSGGGFTNLFRGVMMFDTTVIDTDTISSATLSLYGRVKGFSGNGTEPTAEIVSVEPANTNNLVTADYEIANWGSTRFSDSGISQTAWSLVAYNDFSLNTSGKTNINKTGISKFGLRYGQDIDNSMDNTSGDGSMQSFSADETGTSKDPKLVVVHSAVEVRNRLIIIQ